LRGKTQCDPFERRTSALRSAFNLRQLDPRTGSVGDREPCRGPLGAKSVFEFVVLGLSRSLGAQVIAEGVETEGDAEALQRLGCELAQGYLFARPMPASAVAQDTWRMSAVPIVA